MGAGAEVGSSEESTSESPVSQSAIEAVVFRLREIIGEVGPGRGRFGSG